MTSSEEAVRTAVAEQAGEWFITNQAGELAPGERAAFVAWLKASPIHVEEYLGVAVVARDLRGAVGTPEVSLERFLAEVRIDDNRVASLESLAPRPHPPARRFSNSRAWGIGASAAAALALLTVSGLWWAHDGELLGFPKTYRTAHGEQSVRQLPDGSTLHLNTDSEVTVHYSGRERVVELDRGQVLFEVAHDRSRQFRVVAGDASVCAVGTTFDVYRNASATIVTVAEGQVVVVAAKPSWPLADEGIPTEAQRVRAGYQLRLDAGIVPDQPVSVDLHQALAWLQHKIVFEHRPLGEVAAEFNRYGSIPVEIVDASLRALPISGVFDAQDVESFIAFLGTLKGVRVEKTPTRILVSKVTSTT